MTIFGRRRATMRYESDDLDWAMGDLLDLFTRADWRRVWPHGLDPVTFHAAWTVLNAQPFEVRASCRERLMALLPNKQWYRASVAQFRRAYAFA
jgi:hypothetical protein